MDCEVNFLLSSWVESNGRVLALSFTEVLSVNVHTNIGFSAKNLGYEDRQGDIIRS